MGRNVSTEDKLEKRFDPPNLEDDREDQEEEEALSLCDLPLNSSKNESKSIKPQIEETHQEDFDFELWGGSEMCSADDIFFKGQILPFRNSGHSNFTNPNGRRLSRSESIGDLTSFSSRSSSSSSRTQFSSSSSNNSSRNSKPRIQNQFLSYPSPKPQIRIPISNNRNRKSTVWEFFRLGLVHNPEIELQDLKARNSVSRNSSTSSSSNSSRKQSNEKQIERRLLLSGCDCTVNSVKQVPFTKLKNEEISGKKKKKERLKERTYEWIKELSNFEEEEEGHRHSLGS